MHVDSGESGFLAPMTRAALLLLVGCAASCVSEPARAPAAEPAPPEVPAAGESVKPEPPAAPEEAEPGAAEQRAEQPTEQPTEQATEEQAEQQPEREAEQPAEEGGGEATPGRTRPAALDGSAPPTPAPAVGRAARKEREFLDGFLALARAQPGALEARAAAVLAGEGPPAEKVALLRALQQSGSDEHVRWLEHAVRTLPETSAGPHGVSVPSYALGQLVAGGSQDRTAHLALWRLAFEERGLAPAARRTAAVGFVRGAEDRELDGLRVALARERDELLLAGVLAALRERPESPLAARLLDGYAPSGPGATSKEE